MKMCMTLQKLSQLLTFRNTNLCRYHEHIEIQFSLQMNDVVEILLIVTLKLTTGFFNGGEQVLAKLTAKVLVTPKRASEMQKYQNIHITLHAT